jgi:hypothetical protein
MRLTGACLCGAIKYEISHHDGDVADYCHCQSCRRAAGAPVVAWLQLPPDRLRLTSGTPKAFASSAHASRWFCPDCGAHLYMTGTDNISVCITLATLDTPEAVHPTVHGRYAERLSWFETADELPRYDHAPPYDR